MHAAIEQTYRLRLRVMLIASRRQVEITDLGGGYVEGWDPHTFAHYVRERDPDRRILLCRDHGGPWQHPSERDHLEDRAIADSLRSFRADIDAGFDLLHIDTSLDGSREATLQIAMRRLAVLYHECHDAAQAVRRTVRFEVGFETQSTDVAPAHQFDEQLELLASSLHDAGCPPPTFIVAQTGTRVVEAENDGTAAREPSALASRIAPLASACARVPASLKAHNADYLSTRCLRELIRHGVAAVNIAPELGVLETRSLLSLLRSAGQDTLEAEFLQLALDSGAWKKWLRAGSTASDTQKAILAGHYTFATPELSDIKQRLQQHLNSRTGTVDDQLRAAVGAQIAHLLVCTANPGRSIRPA